MPEIQLVNTRKIAGIAKKISGQPTKIYLAVGIIILDLCDRKLPQVFSLQKSALHVALNPERQIIILIAAS